MYKLTEHVDIFFNVEAPLADFGRLHANYDGGGEYAPERHPSAVHVEKTRRVNL